MTICTMPRFLARKFNAWLDAQLRARLDDLLNYQLRRLAVSKARPVSDEELERAAEAYIRIPSPVMTFADYLSRQRRAA